MRSSNSSPETSARDLASPTQDFASTAQNLASPARSPVEESFYESHIIQSRTAIENLYASNVLSCQKHTKEVKDLARQRKVKLLSFEREQRKFVKKMEELKLKQEAISSPQYSSPFDSGKAQEAAVKVTTRIQQVRKRKQKLWAQCAGHYHRWPTLMLQGISQSRLKDSYGKVYPKVLRLNRVLNWDRSAVKTTREDRNRMFCCQPFEMVRSNLPILQKTSPTLPSLPTFPWRSPVIHMGH